MRSPPQALRREISRTQRSIGEHQSVMKARASFREPLGDDLSLSAGAAGSNPLNSMLSTARPSSTQTRVSSHNNLTFRSTSERATSVSLSPLVYFPSLQCRLPEGQSNSKKGSFQFVPDSSIPSTYTWRFEQCLTGCPLIESCPYTKAT